MLACHFSYAKMTSSPKKKKGSTKQVETAADANSIQLFRENEDRNTLLQGRLYLHEFGKQITQLKVGKNKNELPPLTSFHTIKTDSFREIRDSIDRISEVCSSWFEKRKNEGFITSGNERKKIDIMIEDTMSILSNESIGTDCGNEDNKESEERSLNTSTERYDVESQLDIGSKTLSKAEEELLNDILSNRTSYDKDADEHEEIISVVAEHRNSDLCEKIENDNIKDSVDQRDDRSAMSHHSHSDIHIREKKLICDKTINMRKDYELEENSNLIDTVSIDEINIPFLAKKD